MKNPNPNQRETQVTANVGCSNFRYINKDQSKKASERNRRKKWTREDNKNVIYCYFKCNPTQKVYRKRVTEIGIESIKFNTSQRLTDQAKVGFWNLKYCKYVDR